MRVAAFTCFVIAWSALGFSPGAWGESLPFTAFVQSQNAPVRSAASTETPAVSTLAAGTEVEVWRQESGGWLAIRPTTGSVSWVAAQLVAATEDPSIVEVRSADAVSWIGSQANTQRFGWQVQLKPGERLKRIGNETVVDRTTNQTWLKIEPPAGEFRWIHQRWVERKPPVKTVAAALPPQQVRPASWTAREADSASPENGSSTENAPNESPQAANNTPVTSPSVENHPPAAVADEAEFRQQLDEAELKLAAMVAQPPAAWDLGSLTSQLQQLVSTGPTPLLRGEAKLLWERAVQFQQVQQGYQQQTPQSAATLPPGNLAATPATFQRVQQQPVGTPAPVASYAPMYVQQGVAPYQANVAVGPLRQAAQRLGQALANGPSGGGLATAPVMATAPTNHVAPTAAAVSPMNVQSTQAGVDPRFDGVGWLMPLVARSQLQLDGRNNVPPFALTDKEGNVLQLVTPSPGVNLRRYVRQKVGVYGQAGQLSGVLTPHLTAQRIVVLQRHQ